MTLHHHHSARLPSPLDISEMAKFDDTLDGESDSEVKRKRIFYLRDAGQNISSESQMMSKFKYVFIPFVIIPIFWPFLLILLLVYFMVKKQKERAKIQFKTALEYWQIEISDLQ